MTRRFMRSFLIFLATVASPAWGRTLYLNGTDISSARNQILQGVNVRIDGNGNLFIEAPHYQVHEENTYTPLSQWQKQAQEKAQPPAALPDTLSKVTPPAEKIGELKTEPVKADPAKVAPAADNAAPEKPADDGKKTEE